MDATTKSSSSFKAKSRVDHAVFGSGTVLEMNELHTTIAFDESGTRKFMTSIVKLVPSSTPAPEPPVRRKKESTRS